MEGKVDGDVDVGVNSNVVGDMIRGMMVRVLEDIVRDMKLSSNKVSCVLSIQTCSDSVEPAPVTTSSGRKTEVAHSCLQDPVRDHKN